jgi:hypothetical protein
VAVAEHHAPPTATVPVGTVRLAPLHHRSGKNSYAVEQLDALERRAVAIDPGIEQIGIDDSPATPPDRPTISTGHGERATANSPVCPRATTRRARSQAASLLRILEARSYAHRVSVSPGAASLVHGTSDVHGDEVDAIVDARRSAGPDLTELIELVVIVIC